MTRDPLAFTEDALCRQVDAAIFFVDVGESTREAKKVCALCPVRPACLAYSLDYEIRDGVWGGKSDRERLKMRHGQRRTPAPERDLICITCGAPFHGHYNRVYCDTCRLAAAHASADRRRRAA